MEALGLGLFMVSACTFGTLLEYPGSPVRAAIGDPTARRAVMGLVMGATAVALIYSPWGLRSGAHLNPSTTLVFLRLGRVPARDALGYALAHFAGGAAGVAAARAVLGTALADPRVNYVATVPGRWGIAPAFAAEFVISAVLMLTVLVVSSHRRLARRTGWFAGALVATWIFVEAPVSGMSMNPARSVASALLSGSGPALWIYFVAPVLGMLAAGEVFRRTVGRTRTSCAKLVHPDGVRCIFCEAREARVADAAPGRG